LVRKIVSDPAAAHDKNHFKRFCDFGSYVSRNITFSILVVTELCPAHAHFCDQLLLGDPGCLPSFSDLPPEFFLPSHSQYIDSIAPQM
jgi:hypothetical protein